MFGQAPKPNRSDCLKAILPGYLAQLSGVRNQFGQQKSARYDRLVQHQNSLKAGIPLIVGGATPIGGLKGLTPWVGPFLSLVGIYQFEKSWQGEINEYYSDVQSISQREEAVIAPIKAEIEAKVADCMSGGGR